LEEAFDEPFEAIFFFALNDQRACSIRRLVTAESLLNTIESRASRVVKPQVRILSRMRAAIRDLRHAWS
jgi:hypothetical protein